MPSEQPQVAPLEEHLGRRKPQGAAALAEGAIRAPALGALARGYAMAIEESARARAEEQLTPQALSLLTQGVALLQADTAAAAQALFAVAALAPDARTFRWPLRLCAGAGADGLRAALAGTSGDATLLLVEQGQEALVEACAAPGEGAFRGPVEALPTCGAVCSLFAPEVLRLVGLAGVEVEPLILRAAVKAERVADAPGKSGSLQLGALLAGLGARGAATVSLLVPAPLAPFAQWLETLSGLLPGGRPRVVAEGALEGPSAYGDDRLFVEVRLAGSEPDPRVRRLNAAGLPTLQLSVSPEDLVAEAARWELALAFAAGAERWPPRQPPPPASDQAAPLEPALRDGPLSLYASPTHAAVLRKVAGTLGAQAAASAPHWLAAQLALAGPGELAALHFSALPSQALGAALPGLQAAVRGATRLAVRARLDLAGLEQPPDGAHLFVLSDGGGQELGQGASPGPAARSRRREEAALATFSDAGRPALLLRSSGGAGLLAEAVHAAAALLARPR